MKDNIILFAFLFIIISTNCKFDKKAEKEKIKTQAFAKILVDTSFFNFGKIRFKEPAEMTIKFKNIGQHPLVVYKITKTCGCVSIQWTDKPLKTGEEGIIKFIFDTSGLGFFRKNIYIYYNGEDSPYKITISGEVII